MYLNEFSNEQKNLFLDVAIIAIKANGIIDDNEIIELKKYCREMEIEYREKERNNDINYLLERLKEISNESVLRRITIEIISLMYADNDLADSELSIMDNMKDKFGFSTHLMSELMFVSKHRLLSRSLIAGITAIY